MGRGSNQASTDSSVVSNVNGPVNLIQGVITMYQIWETDQHDGCIEKKHKFLEVATLSDAIKAAMQIKLPNIEILDSHGYWVSGLRDEHGHWTRPWRVVDNRYVKCIPLEDDRFLRLKTPVIKVTVEHVLTQARITITKGTGYTIVNPPTKRLQTLPNGKVDRWSPTVEKPGPVTQLLSEDAFTEYIIKRFGQSFGREVLSYFTDWRTIR
jgi:hypothetical protein